MNAQQIPIKILMALKIWFQSMMVSVGFISEFPLQMILILTDLRSYTLKALMYSKNIQSLPNPSF